MGLRPRRHRGRGGRVERGHAHVRHAAATARNARPQPRGGRFLPRRASRAGRRRGGGRPAARPDARSTRAASSRFSSATSLATPRSSCPRSAAAPRRRWSGSRSCSCANSGRERTSAIVYARRLDAAHDRRADDPHRRHPAAAARQHGPARRRHHGDARPLQHPGLDRHRRRCTTCCPATCRSRPPTTEHETLDAYVEHEGLPTGYWANFRKFIVSLLKAWYGDAATPENDFRFDWLPRIDGDYSQLPYFDRMAKGEVKGYFLFGQNPGGGGPNAGLHRAGLRNLDWLVVLDWFETESAVFWKNDPTGPPPDRGQDRGVLHPRRRRARRRRAASPTRSGCSSGTTRPRPARRLPLRRLVRLQPRQASQAAVRRLDRPEGPAPPAPHLGLRLRRARRACPTARSSRIEGEPDVEKVLQEINGYRLGRDRPAHRPAPAAVGLLGAEGRRHDGVRLLDLQRRLPRAGPQPRPRRAGAPTTRSSRTGASPGRTTAGSCTTAPPPTPRAGPGPSARS